MVYFMQKTPQEWEAYTHNSNAYLNEVPKAKLSIYLGN